MVSFVSNIFSNTPYINLSMDWIGWLIWFILFFALIFGFRKNLEQLENWKNKKWLIFISILLITPIFVYWGGIEYSSLNGGLFQGDFMKTMVLRLMVFSSIPWMLAAITIGIIPSTIIACFSGILLAYWNTHNIFTPLEYVLFAMLFCVLIRHQYHNKRFGLLNHPIISIILLAIIYIPIFLAIQIISVDGSLVQRLGIIQYSEINQFLSKVIELLFAGIVGEVIFIINYFIWIKSKIPVSNQSESFLFTGSMKVLALFITSVTILFLVGYWIIAANISREIVTEKISTTASLVSDGVPIFLENGQKILSDISGKEFYTSNNKDIISNLARRVHETPFFKELVIYNSDGKYVAGYPNKISEKNIVSKDENIGIQLAVKGSPIQTIIIPQNIDSLNPNISFIAGLKNEAGQIKRVLVGRTNIQSNPFTQTTIQAIKTFQFIGGEGMILNEENTVIFNSNPEMRLTKYSGIIPEAGELFKEKPYLGINQYVYYKPVVGSNWSILLFLPAKYRDHFTLNIFLPFFLFIIAFIIFAIMFWRLLFNKNTNFLNALSTNATQNSQINIDQPLIISNKDDLGKFEKSFEVMRITLKTRLDELSHLLLISQGVASNLEIEDSIKPILEAFLGNQGISARVVLAGNNLVDTSMGHDISFGIGIETGSFAYLDKQMIENLSTQDKMIIPNTIRMRRISFKPEIPQPGAIIALALRRDNSNLGIIWVAYKDPRNFSEEELNYLNTLAGQAALAVTNSRLYSAAETGRQRLEAVLVSTPDPVIVIDNNLKLLLINPAALEVEDLFGGLSLPGIDIKKIISNQELSEFISKDIEEKLSFREIVMSNSRVYHASLSPVNVDGMLMGKVCILKDITNYKELDSNKSEFVSTVSHDLRTPLTLMRGYATMLQMVGELNDQQASYVAKIVSGVDNMTKLVNNLLDLGRIEAGIGLQIEQLSAYQVIENVVATLLPQANQKTIQLIFETPTKVPVVLEADPALLQQALYNLVENAIKYTMVGGKVHVGLQVRQDYIIFEVSDTGIGIAPLDLPHLFEKFYRSVRRDTYQQRGTSLGLAIVKSIAEHHKGRVLVESQLGKGSTFYLEIPYNQPKD